MSASLFSRGDHNNFTVASETLEGVFLLNNSMNIHHRTPKPSAMSEQSKKPTRPPVGVLPRGRTKKQRKKQTDKIAYSAHPAQAGCAMSTLSQKGYLCSV